MFFFFFFRWVLKIGCPLGAMCEKNQCEVMMKLKDIQVALIVDHFVWGNQWGLNRFSSIINGVFLIILIFKL